MWTRIFFCHIIGPKTKKTKHMTTTPGLKKNDFEKPVYLANELIQANYNYTSLEIDLMTKIIHRINTNDVTQIDFSMSELIMHLGESNRNPELIKRAFAGLLKKPLTIHDNEYNTTIVTNIISAVKINGRTGRVLVNVDMFILPYVQQLRKAFTIIELHTVLKMSSAHAKRLYLMLSQFRSTGYFVIKIEELRERLDLVDKYPLFSDLQKRVINVALEQINEHSEFVVMLKKAREGRAFQVLEFLIESSRHIEEVTGNERQVVFMKKCGLADWQIENVCMSMTPQQLHPILYDMNINLSTIKKPGAYLYATLKSYGVPMDKALPKQMRIEYGTK